MRKHIPFILAALSISICSVALAAFLESDFPVDRKPRPPQHVRASNWKSLGSGLPSPRATPAADGEFGKLSNAQLIEYFHTIQIGIADSEVVEALCFEIQRRDW